MSLEINDLMPMYMPDSEDPAQKYSLAIHTADAAIFRYDRQPMQVLLVQKPDELDSGQWRFPGGFVDIFTDTNLEEAVLREAREETGCTFVPTPPRYLGSSIIDDPRYRSTRHRIFTTFWALQWQSGGDDGQGLDDVARMQWFDVNTLGEGMINPVHLPLVRILLEELRKQQQV